MTDRERTGLGLILLSAAAYGGMPILAKVAYGRGVGTVSLLAWRFLIASVLFALLDRSPALRWPRRLVLWGLGLVFVGNAIAYFEALASMPATTLALVMYSYPVLVALLAWVAGVESLTPRSLLSAGLAFAGCALTAGGAAGPPGGRGLLLAAVAAVVYSAYIVLSGRFAAGVPSASAAAHLSQVAALVFVPWALARGELALPADAGAWIAVVAIAVLCTVVALRALLAGLARVGPGRTAVMSSLEVVITLALAFAVLGERLGPRQWLGAGLILGAVALQTLAGAGRATLRASS